MKYKSLSLAEKGKSGPRCCTGLSTGPHKKQELHKIPTRFCLSIAHRDTRRTESGSMSKLIADQAINANNEAHKYLGPRLPQHSPHHEIDSRTPRWCAISRDVATYMTCRISQSLIVSGVTCTHRSVLPKHHTTHRTTDKNHPAPETVPKQENSQHRNSK